MAHYKIAIIGAGLAGLYSSYLLALSKNPEISEIIVFEKFHETGGLIRSIKENGYSWDFGSYLIWPHNPIITLMPDIWEEVNDLATNVWLNNKIYNYPFEISKLLKNQSLTYYLSLICDYFISNIRNYFEDERTNARTWIENRVTRTITNQIGINCYLQKLQSIPSNQISMKLCEARLHFIKRMTNPLVLINHFLNKNNSTHSSPLYPITGGIGVITKRLTELCMKEGVKIIPSTKLEKINITGTDKIEIILESENKHFSYNPDYLLLSICVTDLIKYADNLLTNNILCYSKYLKYTNSIVTHFLINKPKIHSKHYILYSFDPKHRWKKCTSISLKNGKTSVIIEYSYDPAYSLKIVQYLYDLQNTLIKDLQLFDEEDIIMRKYIIVENTYPIYEIGFEKKISKIINELEANKKIRLIGRQGTFNYMYIDQVIENTTNTIINLFKV